jgi:hypothetical protein
MLPSCKASSDIPSGDTKSFEHCRRHSSSPQHTLRYECGE